jgi:outer membrane protein OmpA-like peptidoglycan-associated protein
MTRRLQLVTLLLSLALSLTLPLAAAAADASSAASVVASAPVSDHDPGAFPFLPALEGFEPVPPADSTWIREGTFIRYHFQYAPEQAVEVGGRFMMRHFKARDPASQSLDSIVDSYAMLVEQKGGTVLYRGLFHGGAIDTAARSEQQARTGATYLIRTPEREIWTQVSVRDEGAEYVLVVLEKGPLQLKTKPLAAPDLKRSLDETGKAIIYVNFEFDRADLRPDAKPVLDSVYALLKAEPSLRLSIGGHTDNQGSSAYNQALSEKRARAVREALVARGLRDTDAKRLDAAGFGSSMPIADNGTEDGRARNRRVELVKR